MGDCLDFLKDMADNSVDLIVTDPPWGININQTEAGELWQILLLRYRKRDKKPPLFSVPGIVQSSQTRLPCLHLLWE